MLKFTRINGPIYIRPEHVAAIAVAQTGKTEITLASGVTVFVVESIDEVLETVGLSAGSAPQAAPPASGASAAGGFDDTFELEAFDDQTVAAQ